MPLSFTGIDPARATALTSLANRQQQTLVPQFAYQRALADASKQQALAALALNKQQILNQRDINTGIERTDIGIGNVQRNALNALSKYKQDVGNYISQQGTATDLSQQYRQMAQQYQYGMASMNNQQQQASTNRANQAIANFSSAASSLYQANQQKQYAQNLINYINGGSSGTQYPTWQYTKVGG